MHEDEKRVNLEGIFYDKEGNFTPLTDNHGNTSGDLAHLRDTYMESEREYFECLLAIKEVRDTFISNIGLNSDELFKYGIEWQEKVESGLLEDEHDLKRMEYMTPEEKDAFHMRKLEEAEGMMCLLFAAARDKAKILELVKTYDNEDTRKRDLYENELYYGNGMSR